MADTKLGTVKMKTHYEAVCRDKDGNIKWIATAENLVVTAGLNILLNNTFDTVAGAVLWYLGLKGTATAFVAGDTMSSHGAWTELASYSEANRPAWTKNGASTTGSMSNSSSKARFTANGSMTVVGMFMVNNNTKSGTTGTLYGGADFTEGNRSMVSSDTLDVTATVSATAS